jgi:DNA-directed RNA polymerase subunit RPC12/RpoP
MATQVTNYQCPNCTGPLHFVGESGQLECDYCSTQFEVSIIEQLYADKEQAAASAGTEPQWDMSTAGSDWSAEEMAHLRGYTCPSCGAEIICDDTTAATSCPYCNNPTVVPGQFTGQLRPDFVLPFKLDKNAAITALSKHYKGKKFLPKSFEAKNHIEEIKGIYVPFWLFDGESEAMMRFRATKVRKFRQGDYEVTDTEHWRVMREGNVAFEKVPVDGSSKMPDAHMDAIEPFEYRELKPFSSAYLPGYLADKYDVDAEVSSKRANERILKSTENAFANTVSGYSTVVREYSNINLKKGDVKYALMPVWLLSTKWSGTNYLFAMNGQTGKLIGDLPVDKGRYWSWFFRIAAPVAAVLAAILFIGGGLI